MAIIDGLLAYWNFDGTAADASGNGNTLALNGGAAFGQGLFGQGLHLDGGFGSYASEVGTNPDFAFQSGDFTVQIWAEFDSFAGEQTLIEKFTGAGGPGWTFTMPSQLQFYSLPGPVMNGGGGPELGTWHEFIIERAGSEFSMFYDGNLVASATYSGDLPVSSNPLLIGARNTEGQPFRLNGTVDDVAIWDRALSTSEIAALWNGGAGQSVESATVPNVAPAITSNGGGETAAISIMENTSAVTTVQAADPNTEQTLSYSISGGADAFRFDINPTSGALSFKTAPDFENPTDAGPNNVYNVTVEASDGNGGTDTQAIAVTVQNAPGLTVNGGNGPDTLAGAGEEDVLRGRNGNDTLRGLAGNDRLEGENGDDSLTGGLGKDLLIGGAGNDRFVFAALADSPPVGFDVIQDFRHGADRIDLAAIDANAAQGGNQAFTFAGQNAAAVANSVTWSQSGGNTFVWVDVDGNTTADLAIQLTGTGLGLTAADFLL